LVSSSLTEPAFAQRFLSVGCEECNPAQKQLNGSGNRDSEKITHNNGERKADRSEAGGRLNRGASKRLLGDLADQGGDAATLRAYLVSLGVRLGWVGAA
jgi:hypothetical protein